MPVLHKLFQKIEKEKSLVSKHDQDILRKENYRLISHINADAKIPNKFPENQIQQYIKQNSKNMIKLS